jgi:hypothetical protein
MGKKNPNNNVAVTESSAGRERVQWEQYLKPGEVLEGENAVAPGTLRKRRFDQLAAVGYSNKVEPTKRGALEILSERIENAHVADKVFSLGVIAANHHRIPANRYFWTNGLRNTLVSLRDQKEYLLTPAQPKTEVQNELLYYNDLQALYDFGFWRQPDISFEQYLSDRFRLKSSTFELSKILGKEDFGTKHEEWTRFAPRWNPAGLKPGYTQKQALAWLDAQQSDTEGRKKRYLLVASRNSMKSTWARIHALALTITYPDARILIVSETNKLSRKAMKEFRGYLEVAGEPTLFQQYFSEYTIAPDEGQSLIYDNPLAHLGLPQNSVESSSMESANTGSRFDYCVFDDPISRDNGTSNEEQRAAAISKHGSIMKLREPAGFSLNIQTPWVVGDLGEVMIKTNEQDPEHPLAVRIDPVMAIRPEAIGTPFLDLKEQDVTLNFLPKLNWKFVRDEMRSPEGVDFFRTQYMTEWVPDADANLKCQFDEHVLRAHIRPPGYFDNPVRYQLIETVQATDTSRSTSSKSDFSATATGKIFLDRERNKYLLVIVDLVMERVRLSELAVQIISQHAKWNPTRALVEKDSFSESLQVSIDQVAMMRGIPISSRNFFWRPTQGFNVKNRALRVKSLEGLLASDQLWFTIPNPQTMETLVQQFMRFDGVKRSGSSNYSKDDGPDACSLIWEAYGPKEFGEKPPVQQQAEEEMAIQNYLRAQHERIFGNANSQQPPPQLLMPGSTPTEDSGSLYRTLDRFGMRKRAA